jgi:hypothetical protein
VKAGDPGFRHEWLKRVWSMPDLYGPKKVAVALWGFANEHGFCYPNIQQIAQAIGSRSDSRMSDHIRRLAEADFVVIGQQPTAAGWQSNNYRLVIPTHVGSNSPSLLSLGHRPEKEEESNSETAPTYVGAHRRSGELGPAHAGPPEPATSDYGIDGCDLRPPPNWAGPWKP